MSLLMLFAVFYVVLSKGVDLNYPDNVTDDSLYNSHHFSSHIELKCGVCSNPNHFMCGNLFLTCCDCPAGVLDIF